jgi:hypothetical protein
MGSPKIELMLPAVLATACQFNKFSIPPVPMPDINADGSWIPGLEYKKMFWLFDGLFENEYGHLLQCLATTGAAEVDYPTPPVTAPTGEGSGVLGGMSGQGLLNLLGGPAAVQALLPLLAPLAASNPALSTVLALLTKLAGGTATTTPAAPATTLPAPGAPPVPTAAAAGS